MTLFTGRYSACGSAVSVLGGYIGFTLFNCYLNYTTAAEISVFSETTTLPKMAVFSRLPLVDQCMAALTHTYFE